MGGHTWLDNVSPSPNVYISQAALLCEDCGRELIKELRARGVEDTGDSDDFPQGPHGDGGGEADMQQYCDAGPHCLNAFVLPPGKCSIGCPLENPLTTEGQQHLIREIALDTISPEAHQRAVGRLELHLHDYLKPDQLIKLPSEDFGKWPAKLRASLDYFPHQEHAALSHELYTDLHYLYGGATSVIKTTLWRLTITDAGGYTDLSTVYLPAQEQKARTFESMIEEAIEEDAWE